MLENYQDILDEIAGVFADEFDAPVTDVLSAYVDEDGVVFGNLISAGNFYEYAADGNQLALDYLPNETREINDFAAGAIAAMSGMRTDSVESPYEYAYGFLRLDAKVRCKKGGTPCGKICLPKGAKCRKYSGSGNAATMKKAASKLKSPGKALAIGGLASAALAGAGISAYALSRKGGSNDKSGGIDKEISPKKLEERRKKDLEAAKDMLTSPKKMKEKVAKEKRSLKKRN